MLSTDVATDVWAHCCEVAAVRSIDIGVDRVLLAFLAEWKPVREPEGVDMRSIPAARKTWPAGGGGDGGDGDGRIFRPWSIHRDDEKGRVVSP